MKTNFVAIAAAGLLGISSLDGQVIQGGLFAGVSTAEINIKNLNTTLRKDANGTSLWGLEGGVFLKAKLGPVYIKPMALASYQAGQVILNNRDGSIQTSNFNSGRIETPVLFGVNLIGPLLSIEAGPAYNWIFYANTKADGNIAVQTSALGYRVGAGTEFGRLLFGIAYEGMINNSSSDNTRFEMPMELVFNIGVRLGNQKESR